MVSPPANFPHYLISHRIHEALQPHAGGCGHLYPEVGFRLGPDSWVRRWPRVVWGLVCYAHQPEVTDLWFDVVDAFRQESRMDRLLGQDMFWVVTRALDCFY